MKLDGDDLVSTGPELAASAAAFDIPVGELSRLPRIACGAAEKASVRAFFDGLSEDLAPGYRAALATLADPERVGVMHYTLGEESISRAILAWGPEAGSEVVLMVAGEGGDWHIRLRPVASLVETVKSVLLENIPLQTTDIRCTVTQEASLVLLAASHLLRESRLLALLSHRLPPGAFTTEGVESVLDDSATEDFRWPFLFMDKILPFSINGVDWEGRLDGHLAELAERELIREVPDSDGQTWELTESGRRFAAASHHHLTKVGMRITEINDEGLRSHEALLLMRSLHDIFLFDLAGREAAVATIDMTGVERLVTKLLSRGREEAVPAKEIQPDTCPACGESVSARMKFCPVCGMEMKTLAAAPTSTSNPASTASPEKPSRPAPVPKPEPVPVPVPARAAATAGGAHPKFCKLCGAAIKATDKFCKGCGTAVAG